MVDLNSLREAVTENGAIIFRSDYKLQEVAEYIGKIINDPITSKAFDTIDNSIESRNNPRYLSFGQKNTELLFHNDYPNIETPPRFILLHCINEGHIPIVTEYVSLKKFSHSILAQSFLSEPWLIQNKYGRWKRCKILEIDRAGEFQVRLASNVMRPFFPKTSKLNVLFTKAHEIFPVLQFVLKKNDYLLLDNKMGLHRRTALHSNKLLVDKTNHGSCRILERVLIS